MTPMWISEAELTNKGDRRWIREHRQEDVRSNRRRSTGCNGYDGRWKFKSWSCATKSLSSHLDEITLGTIKLRATNASEHKFKPRSPCRTKDFARFNLVFRNSYGVPFAFFSALHKNVFHNMCFIFEKHNCFQDILFGKTSWSENYFAFLFRTSPVDLMPTFLSRLNNEWIIIDHHRYRLNEVI